MSVLPYTFLLTKCFKSEISLALAGLISQNLLGTVLGQGIKFFEFKDITNPDNWAKTFSNAFIFPPYQYFIHYSILLIREIYSIREILF